MNEIKTILASVRIADARYNLIENGDKIAIGISGGKDSMCLFYALHLYSKFKHVNFKIVPIILDLGFPSFNSVPIKEYIKSLGYDLIVYDAKTVFPILVANQNDKAHLPCSICSKMKKACIDKAAKLNKCNKVAFAHHATDAVETLFLNEIYGGRIATFAPKMQLEKDNITFIRPFILVDEDLIVKACKSSNIKFFSSGCPADKHTERESIKELLKSVYKQCPEAKSNFLTMLSNGDKTDIWSNKLFTHIENTHLSTKRIYDSNDMILYYNFMLNNNKKLNKENLNNEHYLIFLKNEIIGTYSLKIDESKIYLLKLDFNNRKNFNNFFPQIITHIEKNIFIKYNPCSIYTKLKYKYFKEKYSLTDGYYSYTFTTKLGDIVNKK